MTEHGHRFTVDLAGAYFSARLSTERQRILDQVQEGEIILDMFAGVGPFAITLAARAALVVAADLNPQAIELMLENLARNRVKNVLPVLADARRLADYPAVEVRPDRDEPAACRDGISTGCVPAVQARRDDPFLFAGVREGEHTARIQELGGTVLSEREVRSYSPGQWHAVYDMRVC